MKMEMATHYTILAWEIPWTNEPDGLQSMGLQKSGTCDYRTKQQTSTQSPTSHYLKSNYLGKYKEACKIPLNIA